MVQLQSNDAQQQYSAVNVGRAACGMEMLTDTGGVDFNSYLRELYISVKKRWFANMPPSIEKGQKGINAVEFRVTQDGNLAKEFPKIVFGSESDFNAASLQAVREAAPFNHLPGKFSKPFIEVRFTFYYNVAPPRR
jgi:outer membrane biosynthesis protein TonB